VVPAALSWLLAAAVVTTYMANQEKEQRALLMQLFSRHVSPEVAATVWQHREQFLERGRLRPQRLVASVLFTDLMGFTSVSEKMPPQELMEWLNEYMEAMVQRVIDHGGVINKYIGDAIMALFGVPLARTTETAIAQDAVHAVHCALAMSEELTRLNQRWQAQGLPTIGMRIGIFTGPVVAGSLGSAQRLEYTVVGDTVNTASRLESFDKDVLVPDAVSRYCRILVGETTARYLSEQFQVQRVGEVSLKGKDEQVTIYHVTGFAAPQHEPLVQQENRG
jgi:adenylate cyclase